MNAGLLSATVLLAGAEATLDEGLMAGWMGNQAGAATVEEVELSGSSNGYDKAVQRTRVVCIEGGQPFRVQELVVVRIQAGQQVEALLNVVEVLQ